MALAGALERCNVEGTAQAGVVRQILSSSGSPLSRSTLLYTQVISVGAWCLGSAVGSASVS